MDKKFIICPVDGATNIKLEVLDFDTLQTVASFSASTPKSSENGYDYNLTMDEFEWFESAIMKLNQTIKFIYINNSKIAII